MSDALNPELRFKDFSSPWAKSRLGDVGSKVVQKNSDLRYSETFTNSAEKGIISQRDYFSKSISKESNIGGYTIVEPDGFVYNPRISENAPVGPIKRNKTGRTGVVSPLYTVFSIRGVDPEYAEWYFAGNKWHLFMYQNGNTGARHDRLSIDVESFFNLPLTIPGAAEQNCVGSFFSWLDSALESGEKKLEKLRQFKQSMLVKMFPQGNSCVPEIRFAGFEGEWSGEDFEDLFDFGRTVVLPREALNYKSGQGLNIHYGDILTKFSYWLTKEEELPFVDNPELVSKALARCLKQGDIIMADTAEDESVGRCVELRIDSSLPIFAGLHTYALTPQKKFAPGYLGVFMNSSMVHEQIVRFSQGTKVTSISKESLKRISCLIPTYQEQARIAEYFRELDELLEAEEEKLEKLRQLKATFLQKMFV